MRSAARWSAVLAMWAAGCGAGGHELAPDDLEVRDLLGLAPSVAAGWDAEERAAVRERLMDAWAEGWASSRVEGVGAAGDVLVALGAVDRRRAGAGQPPVIAGALDAHPSLDLRVVPPFDLDLEPDPPGLAIEPVGWRAGESELAARAGAWAAELAAAAGHPPGAPLRLRAARHAPFGAIHLGGELLINPVVAAALEPMSAAAAPADIARGDRAGVERLAPAVGAAAGGNPYSFYGSVAECAAAQRRRCEDCLPSSTCARTSRDAADGDAECEALVGGDGRGSYLYCVNLSLAIATVAECVREQGPACPQDTEASNQIARLEVNRAFVDDESCGGELDDCLASIYGEPDDDFPPPGPDAGPAQDGGAPPPPPPPSPPPRDVEVSCGEADCDFSPQCDSSCSGSCDDAFSCDADCEGGEGGAGGGGGSNGGSGCDGCSGCDDGCGGEGGDDGDGGGGTSGDGDGGGEGGSDCGSGCCSSGDCGGGDCGNDCNSGGGGSSSCTVAGARAADRACRRRAGDAGALLALAWVIVPLPYLERCRRRARRRILSRRGGRP